MEEQLAESSEMLNTEQAEFKKVKVKLKCGLCALNAKADQPIFIKQDLRYDKQQLAKVISYQQLQQFFHPFKSNPTFKKFACWWKVLKIYILIWLLFLCTGLIPEIRQNYKQIYQYCFLASILLLILLLLRFCNLSDRADKEFITFCETLSTLQNQFLFKAIETKRVQFKGQFLEVQVLEPDQNTKGSFGFIYIYSKSIIEDDEYIKLYQISCFQLRDSSKSKEDPICTQQQFEFDSKQLKRIISFDEFQSLLRPFNSNSYYQKINFWLKFLQYMAVLFMLLCIVIFYFIRIKRNLTQKQQFILLFCLLIVCLLMGFSNYKIKKTQSEMLQQLKKFCDNWIFHPRLKVILHLRETKDCMKCIGTSIYCFQIRKKGPARYIIE